MDLKFEKFIRLTESVNDHEALLALRYAQNMCKKNGKNFSDFILNGKDLRGKHQEIQILQAKVLRLTQEFEELEQHFNSIYSENIKLKKKIQSSKGSKNMSAKYKKLKENLELVEEEYEIISKISDIYEEVYDCHPSERDAILKKLVAKFIIDKRIRINEKEWKQTKDLYFSFIDTCHDVQVMTLKKFSQILAESLGIKPVRGGKKKDLMGFQVEYKAFSFF